MARTPLEDAVAILRLIVNKYPGIDAHLNYGSVELSFRDGVVTDVELKPSLRRGKDFWSVDCNFDDDDPS